MKFFKILLVLFTLIIAVSCSSKRVGTESKTSALRVMSYNIHHCNPPSREGLIDINAIAKVIRLQRPDLVALQEVDVNTKRSGHVNQAALLASQLKMKVYFAKAIAHDGGDYGVAILSRYPLTETQTFMLPKNNDKKAEQRVLAMATITLPDGRKIKFASTHLDAQKTAANRLMQIAEINRLTAKEGLPVIVAGDLNAEPASEVVNIFDEHFTRTCSTCPFTIPVINPRKTIDYIAYRKGNPFKIISHEVIAERYASDHLPVLTVLGL